MQEKDFTYNNATSVWWFIAWRTALVTFTVAFVSSLATSLFIGENYLVTEIIDWLSIFVGIFAQIYFIKSAVNRDYKSKSNGSFRLLVRELDNKEASFSPQTTPAEPADIPPAQ